MTRLFIAFNVRVPAKTSVWSVSATPDVESQRYWLVWAPHLVIEKWGSFTFSSMLAFSLHHSLLGFYEPSQHNKTSRRGQDESERLLPHISTQCHNFFSLRDTDLGRDMKCNFPASRHISGRKAARQSSIGFFLCFQKCVSPSRWQRCEVLTKEVISLWVQATCSFSELCLIDLPI